MMAAGQINVAEKFFLGRQPILDCQQNIFGYELLFRAADTTSANVTDYTFASASVISNAMADFGFQEVLGRHRGFINVDTELLMSDMLELLPKEQVVLELLEMIEMTPAVIERCCDLKAKGFSLALDDHVYTPAYDPLYRIIDIIKVDLTLATSCSLPEIVRQLKHLPPKLLAEKVETVEQFDQCRSLGFEYFQGYFFALPVVLKKKRIDISGSRLIKLQQLLLDDAEIDAIEETFRGSPNLVYNLLCLVNSVSMGLLEKIRSLRHAIAILGRRQLLRWTYLAMFAVGDSRPGCGTLLELAAMRGRLLELIVKRHIAEHCSSDYHEIAFITGILSLVDRLFEVPLEQVVCHLNLTDEVRHALLYREGELGMLLSLVEHLEQTDYAAALPMLARLEISQEQLLLAQLEAINWTHGLVESV
jgi:EAL and modified HD-GYP domain-containing signal transduction protein